jgi:histidinol dehydrogenase
MIKVHQNKTKEELIEITARPVLEQSILQATIKEIFSMVKNFGDEQLIALTKKFDKADIQSVLVSNQLAEQAYDQMDKELKQAILVAKENITKFHKAQLTEKVEVETMPGVFCYQKSVPVERVGIYIPGGTAPLFSTILMLAIPAKIAGVAEIILCSPPTYQGGIHPVILATAKICGIDHICQVGGAQAIAAMATGTKSVPRVTKIFGPGNQYVTAAKEYAQQFGVAIDMPAGPSEVLVYADDTCNPEYVAADLLSQAEHGTDSQVVAVVQTIEIAEKIYEALTFQNDALPRKEIAVKALENSHIIVEPNVEKAFEYINAYAPEHFIIASENADALADRTVNAGSVFLGNYCPEAAGDYASGTNHTLPTYGWAKSYSGVNIDTFMRKITFQKITREGIKNVGPVVVKMAEAEQLQAHANAVKIRIKDVNL